jgi:hypothetical protein
VTLHSPRPMNSQKRKEEWLLQIAGDTSLTAPGAFRFAIGVGSHMNLKRGGDAWPGFGRLQQILGVSRSTIIRGAEALEAAGHLKITRRKVGKKNLPNHYQPILRRRSDDTRVVSSVTLGSSNPDTRVVATLTPEPLNEPPSEPPIEPLKGLLKNLLPNARPNKPRGVVREGGALAPNAYLNAVGSDRPPTKGYERSESLPEALERLRVSRGFRAR